jgi:hypothetical protein
MSSLIPFGSINIPKLILYYKKKTIRATIPQLSMRINRRRDVLITVSNSNSAYL